MMPENCSEHFTRFVLERNGNASFILGMPVVVPRTEVELGRGVLPVARH